MDAFYAVCKTSFIFDARNSDISQSVELLDNPDLKGKPFAVGISSIYKRFTMNNLSRLAKEFLLPHRMKLESSESDRGWLVGLPFPSGDQVE